MTRASSLPQARGTRRVRSPEMRAPAYLLYEQRIRPLLRYSARRSEPLHCGKRLVGNEATVRLTASRRSAFNTPAAFKRPAALIPLKFLELLVVFEAGIVIFPPGRGTAPSSRVSSSSELLTLIAVPVFFPLVVLKLLSLILPEEVTLVLENAADGAAEKSKLEKERGKLVADRDFYAKKLNNPQFVERAKEGRITLFI